MNDSYLRTLERLAAQCESHQHELCEGTFECCAALEEERARRARQDEALMFDAGEERIRLQRSQPDPSWSTSALLGTARELLLTPPTRNYWWRTITITSALARLGERGLNADAVLRTGLARDLVRRVVFDASIFWCSAALESEIAIPLVLQPWVELLEADKSLEAHRTELPGHIAPVAIAGPLGEAADEWIRSSDVADVLNWRVNSTSRADRQPRDLVLRGGRDATLWVIDRFTRTFVSEWRPPSLNWEQFYNADPEDASKASGVSLDVLRERTVTGEVLTEALRQRLGSQTGGGFEQRELGDSSIASLAVMLESRQYDAALQMARRFHEAQPQSVHFAMAYAFCLIVSDPAAAKSVLDGISNPSDGDFEIVRPTNLACCALTSGDVAEAKTHAVNLESMDLSHHAWLWDPGSLATECPDVHYQSVEAWAAQFWDAVATYSA